MLFSCNKATQSEQKAEKIVSAPAQESTPIAVVEEDNTPSYDKVKTLYKSAQEIVSVKATGAQLAIAFGDSAATSGLLMEITATVVKSYKGTTTPNSSIVFLYPVPEKEEWKKKFANEVVVFLSKKNDEWSVVETGAAFAQTSKLKKSLESVTGATYGD